MEILHWEGDTLVVDISNYNGKGDIATNAASARIRGIPASDELHVVERFKRVSEKTINYEATITDPKVYTSPWNPRAGRGPGTGPGRSGVWRGWTQVDRKSTRLNFSHIPLS